MSEETPRPDEHDASTPDDAMRVAARAFSRARRSGSKADKRGKKSQRSTPGSSRDPQLLGSAVEDFLAENGWQGSAALARLSDSWAEVVGPDVAAHVVVESWTDGELVLRADSTAWATQVRLLTDSLRRQIHQAVGEDLVRSVTVRGPDAPSWRAGPRVVKGRGPRDTYG
jgi:predicted nucleic acid-binding Zn ribbon protein